MMSEFVLRKVVSFICDLNKSFPHSNPEQLCSLIPTAVNLCSAAMSDHLIVSSFSTISLNARNFNTTYINL